MSGLQKNVASQNFTFCMISATTGAVDAGATVTVKVTKDNGAQASGTGTVTNSGNGQYNYAPAQAETNATCVGFLMTATGDIAVNYDFHTDIVDSNGYPGVNIVDIAGTASAGTAGYTGVDWGHVNAPTTTVGLTGTTIATTQVVASVTGAVGSVTAGVTVTTNNDKTGYTASTVSDKTGYTLTNAGYAAVMTQQLTESYAAKGTVPTPAQLMLEVRALLAENAVASTTVTTKKIDGSTSAHTYTLDSSTAPTTITTAS